ncbi:MAG TPA: circularly permuted type 2 ATP-grasp protein, partial [Luteolibacter sp.]
MSPWDEMTDRSGAIRPAWSALAASLARWTPDDRAALVAGAERLLEDLGATYNVYTDAGGAGRPFRADPLPLPIEFAEWQRVAAGLEQRGRLLEAVLADVYGPQRLLKEGLLSPDLVHANPDFLPNVRGIQPPGGRYLLATGFDLIRDPWGNWSVLRDHARVPGGLSQTLESRGVSANVLPEEFEASHVAGIVPFFGWERDALHDLTPMRHEPPLVVLLTPGFRHPAYFEHAFKARTLGIPLVEPGDLTVRERRVYLKTLSGLRRVDVVACRLDDHGIDPLELRGNAPGVPGLIEAWRSGNVALANAPGTGFAGSRALMPFLPGICRALLGEDLRLPFVETWWLGQAGVCDRVLGDFGNFVLFPAFGEHPELPLRISSLSTSARSKWETRVLARPYAFVAQRDLSPGTAPVLEGRSLKSRPICWRSFCLHTAQGPQTLKGGLAL